MKGSCEVAAYYFPQWHVDPRNAREKGGAWTEWESLRQARPRFPGHEQPRTPLWGELDESDPSVAERQIDAAADHGITAFIYDWYWDMGKGEQWSGPFLQNALEKGFLDARNRDRLRFGLMWANHQPVTRARFDAAVDYVIERYFPVANYWNIEGGLYFSFYELHTLVKGLGSVEATADALHSFRASAAAAGFPRLHVNFVEWGLNEDNLKSVEATRNADPAELARRFGADSITSYVWIHNFMAPGFPEGSYEWCRASAVTLWPKLQDRFPLPYHPNVMMGWDPSPRTDQDKAYAKGEYPFTTIITGNTPERFEGALEACKAYLDGPRIRQKILTLYAWNEWTEGGYLEPDTLHGYGYLEAVKKVFPPR
jgi:hypothetical protein